MPSYNWHEIKKQRDFNASQYLGQVPNTFVDWEVIALFYSALHYVDSYLAMCYNIDTVFDHQDRKNLIRSFIKMIEKNYRLLYHICRDARYNEVPIGQRELIKAKSYYGNIKFRLTPVVCTSCSHKNLLNKDKCENCGSTL